MNKARRATLADLKQRIEELRDELDELKGEEQDYFDNMPESLQGGEKGEASQTALDAMQEAYDALDQAADSVDAASE